MASKALGDAFKIVTSNSAYQNRWIVADDMAEIIRNEYGISSPSLLTPSLLASVLGRHVLYKNAKDSFAMGNMSGVYRREYSPKARLDGTTNTQGRVYAYYVTSPGTGPEDDTDSWYLSLKKVVIGEPKCAVDSKSREALSKALKARQEKEAKAKTPDKAGSKRPVSSIVTPAQGSSAKKQAVAAPTTPPPKNPNADGQKKLTPFSQAMADAMPRKSKSFLNEDGTSKLIAWNTPTVKKEITDRTMIRHVDRMEQVLITLSDKDPLLGSSIVQSLANRLNTILPSIEVQSVGNVSDSTLDNSIVDGLRDFLEANTKRGTLPNEVRNAVEAVMTAACYSPDIAEGSVMQLAHCLCTRWHAVEKHRKRAKIGRAHV